MTHPLARAAATGASLFLFLAAAVLLACVLANPGFVDDPLLALGLIGLVPGCVGAVLGVALGAVLRRSRSGGALARPGKARRPVWMLGAGIGAVLLLSGSAWIAPRPTLHTRTLLFGLDGATWSVLDPMLRRGELPNLKSLLDGGVGGVLESMEPVISPVVWTNIATGFPRERHGISGFHTRADECKLPRLWNILGSGDQVVGTYKWLVTWPPEKLKGFQIPAWLALGPETTPADLSFVKEFELGNRQRHSRRGQDASGIGKQLAFVRQGIGHGLRLSTIVGAVGFIARSQVVRVTEDEAYLAMNLIRSTIDRDIYLGLLDRYDPSFTTFTYYPTDTLAHRYWKYFEPSGFGDLDPRMVEEYADAIPSAYRQGDAILGEILARIPADADVMVVSDHGFVSANGAGGYHVAGLTTSGMQSFLEGRGARVDVANVGQKLSVGIKGDSPMDADGIRAALAGITWRGQPFIKVDVIDPGSPGTPPLLGLSLAVLDDLRGDIAAGRRVDIAGKPGPSLGTLIAAAENQSGVHHLDGVYLARGRGVRGSPERGPRLTLLDVLPTTLALSGAAVARDLPGKVAGFVTTPRVPAVPTYAPLAEFRKFVGVQESDAAREALEEKLGAIGYVTTSAPEPPPPGGPGPGPGGSGTAPPGSAPAPR